MNDTTIHLTTPPIPGLLPSTTPRVTRSDMVISPGAIVIEGSQFDDGLRRLVVGHEVTDDTIATLTAALTQIDAEEGRRRWFSDLIQHTRTQTGKALAE